MSLGCFCKSSRDRASFCQTLLEHQLAGHLQQMLERKLTHSHAETLYRATQKLWNSLANKFLVAATHGVHYHPPDQVRRQEDLQAAGLAFVRTFGTESMKIDTSSRKTSACMCGVGEHELRGK